MRTRNLFLIVFILFGIHVGLADVMPEDSFVSISGTVRETAHKKKLAGTGISVPGSNIAGDRVQIVKGRRLVSQRSSDTLAVKIVGGPTLPIVFDFVKNEDALFALKELNYYNFKMEPTVTIDNRRQFVISFKPKVKVDYALYSGNVYIDQETQSFTRAEFSLDVSDKEKATRVILYKKPRGLHFKPQEIEFIVTYKYQDGLSYLNYIRTKTRFKCAWKRRLFSSGYTVYAEMVMVDRDDNPLSANPNHPMRDNLYS